VNVEGPSGLPNNVFERPLDRPLGGGLALGIGSGGLNNRLSVGQCRCDDLAVHLFDLHQRPEAVALMPQEQRPLRVDLRHANGRGWQREGDRVSGLIDRLDGHLPKINAHVCLAADQQHDFDAAELAGFGGGRPPASHRAMSSLYVRLASAVPYKPHGWSFPQRVTTALAEGL